MKLQLEKVQYQKGQSSFRFLKREEFSFSSLRHFHPELELTYISQGVGIRFVGDSVASYTAGDLVLLGSNLPHDYVSTGVEGDKFSVAYILQFSSSIIDTFAEGKYLKALFDEAQYGILFKRPSEILTEKIIALSSTSSLENFIGFLEVINGLQSHKNKEQISSTSFIKNKTAHAGQSKILKATRYISENYQNPISVSEMAQLTNMTTQSFCRWFKQITGQSFVRYLNILRIEKAGQLLVNTSLSISNISFEAGFETISHFNRVFKKIKCCTPSELRKSCKVMD